MRLRLERERQGLLLRMFASNRSGEIAYAVLGLRGLQAEIEFPSDWHDTPPRGWIRLGFGLLRIAVSFPWSRVVPDEYQCSGPTYGFTFFDDGLHLHWGKCKGTRGDPMTIIAMPWQWRHVKHEILSEPEKHQYIYFLRSGEAQHRIATINAESRTWWRPWPPFWRRSRSIHVEFNDEVGERTGSWKGGTIWCGYKMQFGEAPSDTLRRMERERKFP